MISGDTHVPRPVNATAAEVSDGFLAEGLPYGRTHMVMACVGAGSGRGLRFVATFQSGPNFGRILAAYGGILVAGSLLRGGVTGGFRPYRFDILGAAVWPAAAGDQCYIAAGGELTGDDGQAGVS